MSAYLEKISNIDAQIVNLQAQLAGHEQADLNRRSFVATAESLVLDDLPAWIATDDPALVNKTLATMIDRVIVMGEGVEIKFR